VRRHGYSSVKDPGVCPKHIPAVEQSRAGRSARCSLGRENSVEPTGNDIRQRASWVVIRRIIRPHEPAMSGNNCDTICSQ
jgi:hypothetical protein